MTRTNEVAQKLADAEERRRWRPSSSSKALLVGVDEGVISLSDAFLAYTVPLSGATLGGRHCSWMPTPTGRCPPCCPARRASPASRSIMSNVVYIEWQ